MDRVQTRRDSNDRGTTLTTFSVSKLHSTFSPEIEDLDFFPKDLERLFFSESCY